MRKFDTLYKRTKTGAIQQWNIVVDDSLDGYSYIMKAAGQLNGKLTDHNEHIREGKQGRTHYEQALFQAESDWKRKHDEGYKTTQDLGISISGDLMHFSFNGADYKKKSEALEAALPQFNTDANGNVKPMLATDWQKIKKVEYPCYCEPKLDGVRCLMIVDTDVPGVTPIIRFLSRSGKDYTTLGHIASDVITYVAEQLQERTSFILDGEIYSDELNFQEIVSAVKAEKPNSLKLKFLAYDIVSEENQSDRRNALKPLINQINSEHIQHVTWYIANDAEKVRDLHDKFVKEGYEGAILRYFEGKYAQGQRSRELLKVKEFDEKEFEAVSWEVGLREEDLIAVLKTSSGYEFKAKMIGTREQKAEFQKQDIKGKQMTVKFFGLTEAFLPRFPIGKALRDY